MAKIFVRARRHVGQGAGRPRFAIVAVEGLDLKVYRSRIRKSELEAIAEQIGAEIVYLPRGEHAGGEEHGEQEGRGHGRRRRRLEREED